MRKTLVELPGISPRALREIAPIALFVTAVVFIRDPGLPISPTLGAWTVLCVSAALWGGVALVSSALRPALLPLPPLSPALLVLCATLTSGFLWGRPFDAWGETALHFTALALAYGLMRRWITPRRWSGVLWVLTGVALALSMSAALELLLVGGLPRFHGAPTATMGRPDHLGAMLVLLIPAVLTCARGPRARRGVIAIAALAMLVVGWTGSLLALLGASAALGAAFAQARTERAPPSMPWVLAATLLIGSITGPWLTAAACRAPLPPAETLVAQWETRQHLLGRGLEAVAAQPWLGAGAGQAAWAFSEAQARHFSAHPEATSRYVAPMHLESDPLELLLEYGLLGIALAILITLGVAALMRRFTPPSRAPLPVFAVSGLAIFVVFSLGTSATRSAPLATIGLLYLACLRGPAARPSLPHWGSRTIALIATLLLLPASVLTLQRHLAERDRAAARAALEAGEVARADALLSAAASHHESAAVAYARGVLALSQGDPKAALPHLEAALRRSPVAEVRRQYGVALCLAGEHRAGMEQLVIADHLLPGHAATNQALERCREDAAPGADARQDASTPTQGSDRASRPL